MWRVLVRAGIPEEMGTDINQFHDGMRARVRMDDGELSDWFPSRRDCGKGVCYPR